jgi:hypothetical protein
MMKTNLLALCASAVALLGPGAPGAAAQDDRVGTAAMEELLVPVTPRTVALGSSLTAGLANVSGVEAVQSNPAALLGSQGTNALFSRSEFVADIGINYLGLSQSFGANSVAISLTNWDYGEIPRTSESSPDVNTEDPLTYEASTFVVGGTFSRRFTDRIGAGFTLKALGRSIDDANSGSFAFDAGITYVVAESGLRFGVALQNLGGEMTFSGGGLNQGITQNGPNGDNTIGGEVDDLPAQLPSVLNFGASYTRQFAGDLSVSGLANFKSVSYDLERYSAGLELGYANMLYARGGVDLTSEPNMDMWQGWNVGAGLDLNFQNTNLKVDYAYRPTNVFGGVNVFSVGVGL